MIVNADSPEWPKQQAADLIRARIESGEYGPRLPSLVALAAELGVATMTVQRALAILKDEGIIYSVPGRGTFTSA